MAEFQDFLKSMTDFTLSLYTESTLDDQMEEFFTRKEKELNDLLHTGSLPDMRVKVKKERITGVPKQVNGDEFKENEVCTDIEKNEKEITHSTRSNALKDVQNNLNINVEKIKEEKLSDASAKTMPPPQQPIRKGRPKKVPDKVKSERESDVIIQLPHISMISLNDSDEEEEKSVRSTRTKTRVKAAKNVEEVNVIKSVKEDPKKNETIKKKKSIELPEVCNEMFSKEELKTASGNSTVTLNDMEKTPVRSTRTRTRAMAAKSTRQEQTNITTVISQNEPTKRSQDPSPKKPKKSIEDSDVVNGTFVKTPKKPVTVVNETIIVTKAQRMIVTTPLNEQVLVDDLLTDDEDENLLIKSKPTTIKKPMFSQYKTSPVKKRVEAFEKLGVEIAMQSQTTSKKNKMKENLIKPSYSIKSKQITPLKSGIPTYTNSSLSASKVQSASKSAIKNMLSTKTISNLKASQQEYIEREARRKEKEQEALRKKEALLQAKHEEIKRKNEEKLLKLAHLKAKQEAEEIERAKEQQRLAKVEKLSYKKPSKMRKERPLYMDITAPLLPLDDCFDSDDERRERFERPNWTRSRQLHPVLMGISYAGMDITNTFFMRKATTPNLEDLFGPMNSQKLKRTSSAVWLKPPRFTLMPIPQQDEEDEDEN